MKTIENGENLSELSGRWTRDVWMPPVYPKLAATRVASRVIRDDQVLLWGAVVMVGLFLCGMLYQHQRTAAKLSQIQAAVSSNKVDESVGRADRAEIHQELERKVAKP